MSAYKRIECRNLVDKDTLLAALEELGLKSEVHAEPVALRGWNGEQRANRAEIVVPKESLNSRFTSLSNDLGFQWNKATNEYLMVCSDYDAHMGVDKRVKQAYAKVAIERALKKNDFNIEAVECEQMSRRGASDVVIVGSKVI